MKKYDVFISYRRNGGDMTATRLYDSIAERRYRVFLDVKTLGPCEFDQRLIDVIKNCKDFVLVLSHGALDRCSDENDWVRREIECAIYNGINIIPVLLPGFQFPENLPESIRRIASHNGLEANPSFWEAFIGKLEKFLVSKKKLRWYVVPAIVAAVAVAGAIGLFGLKSALPDVYKQITVSMISPDTAYEQGMTLYEQKDYAAALPYFEKAAERGNTDALNALGDMYYDGYGVTQDYEKALVYYEEAAEVGSTDKYFRLGYMYQYAQGCEDTQENKAKGIRYYEKCVSEAADDVEKAYNNLGVAYASGRGTEPDIKKAIEYYTKAADMGNGLAMNNLGKTYYYGRDVAGVEIPVDYEKAFEWYIKAEEAGYESVSYQSIGWMYRTGNGTAKDVWQAKAYFEKSIEKEKNTFAMIQLGKMFENGEFGAVDNAEALSYYKRAASQGSADGYYDVAEMYRNGKGTAKNYAIAAQYYEEAIKLENERTDARNALGDLYYDGGYGVTQDYEKALAYYEEAAEFGSTKEYVRIGYMYQYAKGCEDTQENKVKALYYYEKDGSKEAYNNLGCIYESGEGVEPDIEKAIEYYTKAANMGNGLAMNNLGKTYYYGRDVAGVKIPVDYEKAFEWYIKAEEAGYESVSYQSIGWMYRMGNGTRKNVSKAKLYFEKAVEKESTFAMVQLGQMYERGELSTDLAKALEYYERAANLDDKDGNDNAGRMYDDGVGLGAEDDVTAIAYYERAIKLGSGFACYRLGRIYFYGSDTIPTDKIRAFEYYQKGAEEYGYDICMNQLGSMYQYGYGTDIDYDMALQWYLKAAEEGNGGAARWAGDMYCDGIGVPKDEERAKELYRRAVDLGDTEAQQRLDELQ